MTTSTRLKSRFATRALRGLCISVILASAALLLGACGDVEADLITGRVQAPQRCASSASCPVTSPVCDLATGRLRTLSDGRRLPGVSRTLQRDFRSAASSASPETVTTDCTTGELMLVRPRARSLRRVFGSGPLHRERRSTAASKLGLCAHYCGDGTACPIGELCDLAIGGYCVECVDDADCGSDGPCRRSECVGR